MALDCLQHHCAFSGEVMHCVVDYGSGPKVWQPQDEGIHDRRLGWSSQLELQGELSHLLQLALYCLLYSRSRAALISSSCSREV